MTIDVVLWLDEPCEADGYGQVVVMGPVYGQGRHYFLRCLHCKKEDADVRLYSD